MATPLASRPKWRSRGPPPEPCRMMFVRRSTASFWPRYLRAMSFHAGPVGRTSFAADFLGSSLWHRSQPLAAVSFPISRSVSPGYCAEAHAANAIPITSEKYRPMRSPLTSTSQILRPAFAPHLGLSAVWIVSPLVEPAACLGTLLPALEGPLTQVELRCPCDDAGDSPVRARGHGARSCSQRHRWRF